MGRGREASSSCSSSFRETNKNFRSISRSRNLFTDLRLGLGISASQQILHDTSSFAIPSEQQCDWAPMNQQSTMKEITEEESECNSATLFVKVYMEGIPIGRKLNLLALDGYQDLMRTLDNMFNTNIFWSEIECAQSQQCHVLTYEDGEGDWLMVGDVPWEMFLSCVRRLKITRVET